MAEAYDYDVVVIGGGGSGYAAASTAAGGGGRVAMVEGHKLGGTCLNVGCVPTKALLRSAQVLDTVRRAGEFGIEVSGASVRFGAVMERMRAMVARHSREEMTASLRDQGIDLLEGWATFEGPHTLRVGDVAYRSRSFVIASGSAPVVPDIPGIDGSGYLLSDQVLELEELPDSMLIVGGGIIGCEFASFFRAFGADVTVVGDRLLSNEDADVGEELAAGLRRRGVTLLLGGRVVGLARDGADAVATVEYEDGRREEARARVLLVAVGRRARHDGLRIEAAGVEEGERGIAVDSGMRTNVPHIWAAGDVTGEHMYTHAGDHMGEVAGWNAAGNSPARMARLDVVPRPVYSTPEVAAIGLTEEEADRLDCGLEVARVSFADISRAQLDGETEGWCKIVAEGATGRILGASIVGAEANELIGAVAVAMRGGVSAWVLGDTLHPYPTRSEIVRWTADQIGKEGRQEAAKKAAAMRQQPPYSSAPIEVLVRVGEGDAESVTAAELAGVMALHAGYGQEERC